MDFKNVTFYPEFWADAVIYIVVALGLVLLCSCLWDWREKRRQARELAAHQQRREDEAMEE